MDLAPESVLNNRYRIIKPLGQGGMGAVYLAFDSSLDTEVALKSNHTSSKESSTQFIREARLLANLRHSNLPRVMDYFVIGQNQYLVMDYIPGDDLGSVLAKEGPQPVERVLKWTSQLSSALTYMHNQYPQVIHRDIKPANLKLMANGEVMLVDFGIAKAADSSQATATGAMGYTPGYAPPEQYGGSHTGPFSDQYSLGATLYTLLANQKPTEALQRLLGQATLMPLRTLAHHVPVHVEAAIHQSMALRPEERFPSIQDFNKALNNPNFQPTVTRYEPLSPAAPSTATQTAPARAGMPPPPVFSYQEQSAQGPVPHAAATPAYYPQPIPKKKSKGLLWGILGGVVILGGLAVVGSLMTLIQNQGKENTAATITAMSMSQLTLMAASTEEPEMAIVDATITVAVPTAQPIENISPTLEAPTASPLRLIGDGKKLAFISDRGEGGTLQVWTMQVGLDSSGNPAASDLQQVTFDAGDKSQPAWSPDGTQMLFSAPGPEGNGLDVFLLDLASQAEPVNVSNFKGDDTDAAWSPDGNWIAYVNQGRFTDVRQIYISRPDGGNRNRISLDYEEYSPVWSPDMNWLFYVVLARDHNYFWYRNKTADYATPQPYDPSSFFGRLGEVADPAFSPDGSLIAYTKLEASYKMIFSMEFESRGGKTSQMTENRQVNYQPVWSPDAQWIAFSSERDGNPEIYLMTSAGLMQTNLTNADGINMQPTWQH